MNRERKTHPSYALASFSRVSGETYLFGSEFRHNGFISLKIDSACVTRDLSHDWHFGDKGLIEVWMSEAQFVQLISRLNMGSGTPVTLRWHNGHIEAPPVAETARQKHEQDFKAECVEAMKGVKAVEEKLASAIDKGKIGKTEIREILQELRSARSSVSSTLPWVEKQFAKATEATVSNAKVEIEAHLSNVMRLLGTEQMRQEFTHTVPRLSEGDSE